jgi:hypothetical protein
MYFYLYYINTPNTIQRMIKRFLSSAAFMLLALNVWATPDEGMWLPLHLKRLNQTDMQTKGLQLTAEEIYSINNSSLKDAIVSLGGFCTAEVISGEGLLLTNHHCAFDAIQTHSSTENDYVTDGFWAMNRSEEKANKGLTAAFLVRMEDVTKRVLSELNPAMSEAERQAKISAISQTIRKEAEQGTHYNAVVKPFFDGNEFYMFVYETYRDVRLVGAPPSSIGKFGGDTDNWMWPRQTGDFAMFRVYAGKDGKPADYSPENVPLTPRHHLPISMNGVQNGDFAMVMGYPGSTNRYLTSFGVKTAMEQTNPARVKVREKKLNIMKEDMDASDKVRIQYVSKYARISNYWKYFIGQTKGLKRLNVAGKKEAEEAAFTAWVNADANRKATYGEALPAIANAFDKQKEYNMSVVYLGEAALGTEILAFANGFRQLQDALKNSADDKEKIAQVTNALGKRAEDHFKDYNQATDRKLFAAMMEMYSKDVPANQQPQALTAAVKKYKGNFGKWTSDVFAKSLFASKEKTEAFLANPSLKVLEADPAFATINSFMTNYIENILPKTRETMADLEKGNRLYVAGTMEMNPNKKFAPNANSTMRLTYGQVLDYQPRDGVTYNHFTTLDGVMEKEDPSDEEFVVPAKLRELYEAKDYGPYAENGVMKVGFITNTDITGGNSGSPVINAKGQLIGCAFDGNWEAMSGDIAFEPELQRTISVDIRYILFIIDKFAGAGHLVKEMTLVDNNAVERAAVPVTPEKVAAPAAPKTKAKAAVKK